MTRWWIIIALLGTGCAAEPRATCCAKGSSRMVHVVVCWLKSPGDDQARQKLIDASRDFRGKIPGLICVSAGRMSPSTRPAVDSTYDVAIVMSFVDEAALINYGKSPQHQQAVRDVLRPLVEHYVVYDFVDK